MGKAITFRFEIIITIFISSSSVIRNVGGAGNISCISCHKKSPPNHGCLDKDITTQEELDKGLGVGHDIWDKRGQDVVPDCVSCAIEDTWSLTEKEEVLQRRKMCLTTTYKKQCTYHFPIGTDHVVETCRCNTELCNLGDITSIGGLRDFVKLPKVDPLARKEQTSGSGLGLSGMLQYLKWIYVIAVITVMMMGKMDKTTTLCFAMIIASLISSTDCKSTGLSRNISCLSCHKLSPPNFGCQDRKITTEAEINQGLGTGHDLWDKRGQDVVPDCVSCAIQDTWFIPRKELVLQRRKLCLLTSYDEQCTYDFPVGTEHVVETCRCRDNLCNLGDITSIGGLKDFDKFPKIDHFVKQKEGSGSRFGLSGMLQYLKWIYVIVKLIGVE